MSGSKWCSWCCTCRPRESFCSRCCLCKCCCRCPPPCLPPMCQIPPLPCMPCMPPPPPPTRIIREQVYVPVPVPYPVCSKPCQPCMPKCYPPPSCYGDFCCSPMPFPPECCYEPDPAIAIYHPCPPAFPKRIYRPGRPLLPGYQGHVPGLRMHGAGRTFAAATKDTRCIMSQWESCCPRLPRRIFEQ